MPWALHAATLGALLRCTGAPKCSTLTPTIIKKKAPGSSRLTLPHILTTRLGRQTRPCALVKSLAAPVEGEENNNMALRRSSVIHHGKDIQQHCTQWIQYMWGACFIQSISLANPCKKMP
eukprot:scaffold276848_cov17-Tisochrysis_lutea.AAC.1